uniref:Uncharacterized protein n=1 Tax=Panagrolaimus davidi TaxID=227884 RepID=A0A914QEL2_9BILA
MEVDDAQPNGVSTTEATNGQEKVKTPRGKGKKKQHEQTAAANDDDVEANGGLNGQNENNVEATPVSHSRKRKAAQRAEANLAVVPLSQRKDDSDEDDQDYIVESPDEEGNPKRSKLHENDSEEDDDDWSHQTLEQRVAALFGGGVFYDANSEDEDSDDDNEEEDETEVELWRRRGR